VDEDTSSSDESFMEVADNQGRKKLAPPRRKAPPAKKRIPWADLNSTSVAAVFADHVEADSADAADSVPKQAAPPAESPTPLAESSDSDWDSAAVSRIEREKGEDMGSGNKSDGSSRSNSDWERDALTQIVQKKSCEDITISSPDRKSEDSSTDSDSDSNDSAKGTTDTYEALYRLHTVKHNKKILAEAERQNQLMLVEMAALLEEEEAQRKNKTLLAEAERKVNYFLCFIGTGRYLGR